MAGMCRALTVAILVVLINGLFLKMCSAQYIIKDLPVELQNSSAIEDIKKAFCRRNAPVPIYTTHENEYEDLYYQLCTSDNYSRCWEASYVSQYESPCKDEGQSLWCRYFDANVCKYEDGRGSCIYSFTPSEMPCQCIYKNGTSTRSEGQGRGCEIAAVDNAPDTTQAPSTANAHDTTQAPSTANAQNPTLPLGGSNVATAVLGSVLSVVLLVILGIGVRYFWRKKRTVSREQTPKPEENKCSAENSNVGLPEPPVCGKDHLYTYVDERRRREPAPIPTEQPQKVEISTQKHLVNNDSKEEKMIKDGDNSAKPPPNDPEYFVLEKNEGGETDETDGYQSLIKNGDQGSGNSGYDVARPGEATTEDLSGDDASSYDHLDRATGDKPSNEGTLTKVDEQDDYNIIEVARPGGASTEDLSDDASSYDHLDRATVDKRSNEGALTKVDEQDDYNHIK